MPSDKFGIWVVPPLVVTREELEFVVCAIDDALNLADEHIAGSRSTQSRAPARRT